MLPRVSDKLCVLLTIGLLMLVVGSCSKKDPHPSAAAITDRAAMPLLEEHNVVTLISDSGVTRYRITAQQWLVYDKSTPPCWDFPYGIQLEQFDEKLQVGASLRADRAHYDQEAQLWRLWGHVRATNIEGDKFYTEELFWDRINERVYSDSAIAIRQKETLIRGIGFDANQTMTQYTIRQTNGIIPIKE
ncbi:MAG: LPS export ABC transporter periplasmic protein LptC [Paludibacteraceae bacterium]|nr:LPS export ABC transporter periplasmic protein LptC [Paludibacteraceae bacterium]